MSSLRLIRRCHIKTTGGRSEFSLTDVPSLHVSDRKTSDTLRKSRIRIANGGIRCLSVFNDLMTKFTELCPVNNALVWMCIRGIRSEREKSIWRGLPWSNGYMRQLSWSHCTCWSPTSMKVFGLRRLYICRKLLQDSRAAICYTHQREKK